MSFFVAIFLFICIINLKLKSEGKNEKTFDDSWDIKRRKDNDL